MVQIQAPDGQIIEFPDNMTREQIESVMQKQYPPSYLEQLGAGSPARQMEMQRIQGEYEQGKIGLPLYVTQSLGEAAGNIQDVMGRAIGDIAGGAYGLLPENAQQKIESALAPAGQAVAPYLQSAGEMYGQMKQEYPKTMETAEAIGNIGMLAAPMFGRATNIKGGVSRSGEAIAGKLRPKPSALSADELKATANQLYQAADAKGGVLKPQVTNKFVDDVVSEAMQTDLGKAVLGDSPVASLVERINAKVRNKPMTLQAAQEIDEALGELAYRNMNSVTGQLDKQGLKFINIQSKFRSAIENAPESMVIGGKEGFDSLKEARNYWSTSLRLADVEKAIQKGLATEQPQTGIKNAFKTLLNSKKIKQYSPAEVQAIKQAANKGVLTDIMGTMGSRLNPQFMAIGTALTTKDPVSAAAAFAAQTAISGAARKAATGLQLKKARYVEDLIRQRVGEGGLQKMKLTPEIVALSKELGIAAAPGGAAREILQELKNIQETGTIADRSKN